MLRPTRVVYKYMNRCYSTSDEEITKILRVSFVGAPNAGKSTLINSLIGQKLCSVSSKVHTTRSRSKNALTVGDTQLIFSDTPGVVSQKEVRKHDLETSFLNDPLKATSDVNIIGVVHDVSNRYTRNRIHANIISILQEQSEKKSILILNKIDRLSNKSILLDVIHTLTKHDDVNKKLPYGCWNKFSEIFMLSGLTGDGKQNLLDYLLREAQVGKWMFTQGKVCDKDKHIIIMECVKAKLLDSMSDEVPYYMNVEVEYLHETDVGDIVTVVLVNCPSSRYERMLLSKSGKLVKKVAESAEADLRNAFQTCVRLRIFVRTVPEKKKLKQNS